jgi:hypothetical protein
MPSADVDDAGFADGEKAETAVLATLITNTSANRDILVIMEVMTFES